MATPGASIADRITDLIGSEYATVPSLSYNDLINAAFNEVADMLSIDELMKYSSTPTNVTSASGLSIEDKKILKVIRVDADSPNGIDRECRPIEETKFSQATDANSLYQATAFSPVYTIYTQTAASDLHIHPVCNDAGQIGRVWTFAYAGDSTTLSTRDADYLNSNLFMPPTSIHAIVLKSCLNILQTYMGNQIQNEEDVELMQMIKNQIQSLEKAFLQEMQRFTHQGTQIKGE
jgi:hypothetical protein